MFCVSVMEEEKEEEYFNVRRFNGVDATTRLHISIADGREDVALELVRRGANINAQDINDDTPLHVAIKNGSHEMMCMLLCYGADVNISDRYNRTPLILALYTGATESAATLINYYDDFSQMDDRGYNALLVAMETKSQLRDLINVGAYQNCASLVLFECSIVCKDAEFFKHLWCKSYPEVLYNGIPFIITYLKCCLFNSSEWLECLYLMLTSPIVSELVDHYNVYIDYRFDGIDACFFYYLMLGFKKLNISQEERMKILSLCLSLGITSDFGGLETTYMYYGFDDELNILIYAGDVYPRRYLPCQCDNLIVGYILGMEPPKANFHRMFDNFIMKKLIPFDIMCILKFFTLDCETKDMLTKVVLNVQRMLRVTPTQLAKAQTLPSLQELCRTRIRNLINTEGCDMPYKFHQKIKSLRLPPVLTDVLLFKRGIYFFD